MHQDISVLDICISGQSRSISYCLDEEMHISVDLWACVALERPFMLFNTLNTVHFITLAQIR